jgi:hypothetical protein
MDLLLKSSGKFVRGCVIAIFVLAGIIAAELAGIYWITHSVGEHTFYLTAPQPVVVKIECSAAPCAKTIRQRREHQ